MLVEVPFRHPRGPQMPGDHDQRFKSIIREFFADFLKLFFADWAVRLDLTRIEWLTQELLPDPPDGDRHIVDLVAKLPTLKPVGDSCLLLVHVEIESPDKTTLLEPRLPGYYLHLKNAHQLPVLPIVIYLKVGLDGIGIRTVTDSVWELDVSTFRYLYVGLPGLEAEPYLHGDNWLGVALSALMKLPKDKAAEYGAEALRRLSEAGSLNEQQRYLLGDCVEAYLPIEQEHLDRFDAIIEQNSTEGVRAMNKTRYERAIEAGLAKGIEQGIEQGIERGLDRGRRAALVEVLEALLDTKFGPLAPGVLDRLRGIPDDRLLALVKRVPFAASLQELAIDLP